MRISQLVTSLVLLVGVVPLSAHDMMMVMVESNRVTIGAEFVPRSLGAASVLVVPAGQTVELPATATYDYVEVAGTLRVSRTHDTQLRVTTMLVLPSGMLDVGTFSNPIPCERHVEIVFRNVPIDTTRDPFRWGNGLLNFGNQTRVGCEKTSFLEAVGSLAAGQTIIDLATVPSGWATGDALLLPDTDQPIVRGDGVSLRATPSRREAPVTIAAISNTTLTLSKGLDFAHNNITDPQGVVVLRPRVANLTRNIVLRSEAGGVSGTHGHTADVGMEARWDVRANEFHDLGRTLNVALNDTNTTPPYVIGTNQRGKYADHKHHTESCPTCVTEDNVYVGNTQTSKWGLALHGASDTLVKDNIAIDWPGAGFVTEDGNEVRNSFIHNLAAYIVGAPADCCNFNGQNNAVANNPGTDGNGFWWRGVMNTFIANEGWNSFRGGNLFNQNQPVSQYSSAPGLAPDTDVNNHAMLPIVFRDNVFAANTIAGLEFWAVRPFVDENLIAAYNNGNQVIGVQSDGIGHWMRNPTLICKIGTNSIGVSSSDAYTGSFVIDGDHGKIAGCAIGIAHGGGKTGLNVTGATLQNELNINRFPESMLLKNVMHVPLPGFPHRYINFVDTDHGVSIWAANDPLPKVGIGHWAPQRGSQFVVKNWQGTGQDYLLFYPEQLASNAAWYSDRFQHRNNCPEKGMTMLGCWNKFGLSIFGDVLKESDAVTLDGLVNGFARKGLGVAFGPPKAIVTFPTMRASALGPDGQDPSVSGYVEIDAVLTGDPNAASNIMVYSVDGDTPYAWGSQGESSSHLDVRDFNSPHSEPGLHSVRTWRTRVGSTYDDYTVIPESDYTATFFIGTTTPLPPSSPPPGIVVVPALIGLQRTQAVALMQSLGLALVGTNTTTGTGLPNGTVINQSPRKGTRVPVGSGINLELAAGGPPSP